MDGGDLLGTSGVEASLVAVVIDVLDLPEDTVNITEVRLERMEDSEDSDAAANRRRLYSKSEVGSYALHFTAVYITVGLRRHGTEQMERFEITEKDEDTQSFGKDLLMRMSETDIGGGDYLKNKAAVGGFWDLSISIEGGILFWPPQNFSVLLPQQPAVLQNEVRMLGLQDDTPGLICRSFGGFGLVIVADGSTASTISTASVQSVTVNSPMANLPEDKKTDRGQNALVVVLSVAFIVAIVVLVLVGLLIYYGFRDKETAHLALLAAKKQMRRKTREAKEMTDAWVLSFDDVHIQRPSIGRGATAEVFKGTYNNLEVAVKVLSCNDFGELELDKDPELKFLMRVRHPKLALFLGCGRTNDGDVFVVQELMLGGGLNDILWAKHPRIRPWAVRLSIAVDVAEGMEYLHSLNALHRDLKSPNVLVSSVAGTAPLRAKVADFGLARIGTQDSRCDEFLKQSQGTVLNFIDLISEGGILHTTAKEAKQEEKILKPDLDSVTLERASSATNPAIDACDEQPQQGSKTNQAEVGSKKVGQDDGGGQGASSSGRGQRAFDVHRPNSRLSKCGPGHSMQGHESTHHLSHYDSSACGTLQWMAPELLSNMEKVVMSQTQAIDVYAYALVLWELLEMACPWKMELKRPLIKESVINGRRPALSKAASLLGRGSFINLMKQCWEQRPEERPSFDMIVFDIRACARGSQLSAN